MAKEKHFVQISFNAMGWIKQDIEVKDPNMTADQMVEMLYSGDAYTTVHEDNDVIRPDGTVLGTVLYSETELDFTDFEAEDTYTLANDGKPFNASQLALQAAVGEFVADTDDIADMSAADILEQVRLLKKHSFGLPTGITIEERYASMTGEQIAWEIEAMAKGLKNLMQVAYDAGKDGQEFK